MYKRTKALKKLSAISLIGLLICLFCMGSVQNLYAAGTSSNVIKIYSVNDMLEFIKDTSKAINRGKYKHKTIKLMKDIDFKGTGIDDAGYLDGIFDGGGHTISGIEIEKKNKSNETVPSYLFNFISEDGIVKNLKVKDSCFLTKDAMVIAYSNEGTIQNCMVEDCIIGNGSGDKNGGGLSSGICGSNYGEIINCSIIGSTLNNRTCSGLVALNYGKISNCYVDESVVYDGEVTEGLVRVNRCNSFDKNAEKPVIENCYNAGVALQDNNPTGICDVNEAIIKNCYCFLNCSRHVVYQNEGIVTGCDILQQSMMADLLANLNSFADTDKRLSTWVIPEEASYPQLQSNISTFNGNSSSESEDDPLEDDNINNEGSILAREIKIISESKKIAAGKRTELSVKLIPGNVTDRSVIWESSNKKYAEVDHRGIVTTKKAGAGKKVVITAATNDGSDIKASITIQILKNSVKKILFQTSKQTLKTGKTLQLNPVIITTGDDVNKKLYWTSSNKKYATVSQGGKVAAKKAGKGKTVTITARSTDGTNKKANIKIRIE